MLDLKGRRNRIVPISRLPPEILCSIFFFASRLAIYDVQWIRLTHVCRYWRDLALQSPSLWANPPLQHILWTEIMLSRSKMAGLTVQADGVAIYHHNTRKNVSSIFQNYNTRIKHIQLELSFEVNSLLETLPSSAPMLESLVITVPYPNRLNFSYQDGSTNRPNYRILDESLCDMGQLRRMELTGLYINWDLHLPNTLTVLKLHEIPSLGIPEIDKMKDALEQMPLLQTLDLVNALPDIGHPLLSSRNIHLPKLQTLKLSAGVAEADCLLRALTFPSTTFVQVICAQSASINYFNMSGIFSSLARSRKDGGGEIKVLEATLSLQYIVPPKQPGLSKPSPLSKRLVILCPNVHFLWT